MAGTPSGALSSPSPTRLKLACFVWVQRGRRKSPAGAGQAAAGSNTPTSIFFSSGHVGLFLFSDAGILELKWVSRFRACELQKQAREKHPNLLINGEERVALLRFVKQLKKKKKKLVALVPEVAGKTFRSDTLSAINAKVKIQVKRLHLINKQEPNWGGGGGGIEGSTMRGLTRIQPS